MKVTFGDDKWEYSYNEETEDQLISRKGTPWHEYNGNWGIHEMAKEIQRLKEYEWMYKGLSK